MMATSSSAGLLTDAPVRAPDGPLVSVGMPVYNGEPCVAAAIEAALAQTYTNLEIIICDNCSSDKTGEIALRYAAREPRIRYHRWRTHADSAVNFFRALSLAKGELFLWMCADDNRPPDAVERLVAAIMRHPAAVMAHGPIIAQAVRSTKLVPNRVELSGPDPTRRVRELVRGFEHNGMIYGLYKTAALRRVGFKLHYGRDLHLCLQMALFGRIEYSAASMISLHERTSDPAPDPMGCGRGLTVQNIMGGAKTDCKVWTTLLYGWWYLLTRPSVRLSARVASACAFGSAFIARYRTRLLTDAVLMAGYVVSRLGGSIWSIARRSSLLLAIARRLKPRGASA